MPTRTGTTSWTGGLREGSGTAELTSSDAGSFDVSFPKRAAKDADGTTSPEELIGAAHSSCYAMSLTGLISKAGGTNQSLRVSADVTVSLLPDGGLRITESALTVRGTVDGLDEAAFVKLAEQAKDNCPVSKALAGVDNITLDAALD